MALQLPSNSNRQFTLEAPAVSQFVSKVIAESQKRRATGAKLFFRNNEELVMNFSAPQESSQKHTFTCSTAFWKSITNAFRIRAEAPKVKSDSTHKYNLTIQHTDETIVESELWIIPAVKNTIPSIELKNITQRKGKLSEKFNMITDYNQQTLHEINNARSGIAVVDMNVAEKTQSAFTLLSAINPKSRLCTFPGSKEDLRKIIECSHKQPILLGWSIDDPVEALFEIGALTREDKTLLKEFYSQVHATYTTKTLRKTCSHCAKVTTVSPSLREKLPEVFRDQQRSEYMFGRGCDACGHSTYLGTVTIESSIDWESDSLKEKLLAGATAGQLTELASRNGARSLLEDGLSKIDSQLTTYEELLGKVKHISSGFLSAAVHRSDNSELLSPVEKELDIHLSDFDSEFFFKEGQQEKPSLLIIEDNTDQRDILKSVLEQEGYLVRTATHGQEGLTQLHTQETDLVICDLMMPVMNGEEFVKELRRGNKNEYVPVLMLTAIDDEESEFNLLAAGADDYCSKGTKKKLILKRIERLLTRSQNPLNA